MADQVDAKTLPDFQCSAYRRMAPLWAYLDDLFIGSESWVDRLPDGTLKPNKKTRAYLPQFLKEHSSDYEGRLNRTPFSDRFAQAIKDFVGLILHNGVQFSEDFPPILRDHWQNINNEGQAGTSFLSALALAVMRRGHSFILVDCQAYNSGGQVSIAQAKTIRPYWVHIHAPQVLSWRSQVVNGQKQLSQAIIRQVGMVPDGAFGEREEVSYLMLSPGRYDTFTIAIDANDRSKKTAIHHPDRSGVHGIVAGGRAIPFTEIPLIPVYGGLQTGFFESEPTLKSLADLNLTHYQLYSDHLNKIHTCCFPTPVRVGAFAEEGDELVLGPGVLIDLVQGGNFFYAEPNASSIDQSRKEIESLEMVMDFLGTQYLVKPSDRQAAMVSLVQSAKVESSLELFTRDFVQGVNQAIAFHAKYLQIAPGRVDLDTSFLKKNPSDSQRLQSLTALANGDFITKRSLLEEAKEAGYLSERFNVEREIQQVGEQVEVIPIGQLGIAPDTGKPPPSPAIDPAVIIDAYVKLASADKIPVDQVLSLLANLSLSSKTKSERS